MAGHPQRIYTLVLIFGLKTLSSLVTGLTQEFCNEETFQAECGGGRVVLVEEARYGRMHVGRCVSRDLGFVGRCENDVVARLHRACSGRTGCSLHVLESTLGTVQGCSELKSFLQVTYSCVEVVSPGAKHCNPAYSLYAPPPPAYFTNEAVEKGCGTEQTPWTIELTHVTQKINLTLLNIATRGRLESREIPRQCRRLAVVKEHGQADHVICDVPISGTATYVSRGNTVKLVMTPPSQLNGSVFMIRYEAAGCETPKHDPDMTWMKVGPDHVTLGCFHWKDITWQLQCRGGIWHGEILNCSAESAGGSGQNSLHPTSDTPVAWWSSVPREISVYVLIAIGILLMLLVLLLVIWAVGRRRRSNAMVMYGSALQRGIPAGHMHGGAPVWSINKPLEFQREPERMSGRYVNRPLPPVREESMHGSGDSLDNDFPTWARRGNTTGRRPEHIYYELDPYATGYRGQRPPPQNNPQPQRQEGDTDETGPHDQSTLRIRDDDDMDALIPVTPLNNVASPGGSVGRGSPKLATIAHRPNPRVGISGRNSPRPSPCPNPRVQRF